MIFFSPRPVLDANWSAYMLFLPPLSSYFDFTLGAPDPSLAPQVNPSMRPSSVIETMPASPGIPFYSLSQPLSYFTPIESRART
jgi:hypothetical protein